MATESEVKIGDDKVNFRAAAGPSTYTTLRKESSVDSAFSELLSPISPLGLQSPFPEEGSGEWPQSPPPPSVDLPSESLAGSETTSLWLDTVIDTENHGVNKHLGKVANVMSKWEGRISDELGLTCADVAAIKTKHPLELKLQTREALLMWKQRVGERATYRKLIHVFKEAGYKLSYESDSDGLTSSPKHFTPMITQESTADKLYPKDVPVDSSNCKNGVSDSINAGELDKSTRCTISKNEAKIKDSFSDLLDNLGEALIGLESAQEQLDVSKVHRYLTGICPKVPKTSLSEMFVFVTSKDGWSYENYSPLDKFVNRFLPHEKRQMVKYKNDLSGFCVTEKLIDYIHRKGYSIKEFGASTNTDDEPCLNPEYCHRLKLKLQVERKVSALSLQYVYDLWADIAEEFDIPYLTTIIDKIIEGSLIIVWLILRDAAEKIATSASTEKAIHFFLQHEIVHVAIDKQLLFDTIQFLLGIVTRGDWQRLKALLRQYKGLFDLDVPYQDGKSLLIIAAELGDDLVILTLFDSKADISFKQESTGRTALFFAAEKDHDDTTAILLAYGADPHQKDSVGIAALKVATEKAFEEFRPYVSEYSAKQPTVRYESISTQQRFVENLEGLKDTFLGRLIQPIQKLTSNLIGAAKSDYTETVEYILMNTKEDSAARELIRARENDKHGWTALMYASDKGNARIAEQLLSRGADPNESAKNNGWTCLMLASRRGSLQVTKMLLDYGADPNLANNEEVSPLSIALYERRTAVPLLLIHRGADVHFPDQNGWTPLIRASNEGNLKLAKIIADLGANLNDQTYEGWSSLMVSSNYGHIEVVRELANRGAELNLATREGDTALHLATLRNRPEVVEELAKLGADLNAGNKDGLTALMVAANKNYVGVADALLEGGADPNQPHQETKWTAVFFAAKNGHVEIVQNLLFHKAKTEILNEDDSTKLSVLDVASHLKQMAILSALGTPVDYTPSLASRETKDIENNVKTIDSLIRALEHRFRSLKKALS